VKFAVDIVSLISHNESCRTGSERCLDEPSKRELCSISDDGVLGFAGRAGFSAICNVDSSQNHRSLPQGEERVRRIEGE
jgi:hypothetical protein